jgi:hypothetical protein
MGLQWISAESRHRHMSHKSAAFLLRRSVTLLCARWTLSEKTSGVYPLMQESILTIPTQKKAKGGGLSEFFFDFPAKERSA